MEGQGAGVHDPWRLLDFKWLNKLLEVLSNRIESLQSLCNEISSIENSINIRLKLV